MLNELQKQIKNFENSSEYKDLQSFYSQPSLFKALGVARHENTHSNFLAWLLDSSSNHGLGDLPLRQFLHTVSRACMLSHSGGKLSPDLAVALAVEQFAVSDISVEREKQLDSESRADIFIKCKVSFDSKVLLLTILIENKIASREFNSETVRYQEALRRAVSPPDEFIGIYLTPMPNSLYEPRITPSCECKDFIELNYQYLADYVVVPCLERLPEGSIKRYLEEYLLALCLPGDSKGKTKGVEKMAISKEEKDLLSSFWYKHKDLIATAVLYLSEYVPLKGDDKEEISQLADTFSDNRDRTRYSWEFQGRVGSNLSKRQLVQEVIGDYVKAKPSITVAELSSRFSGAVVSVETARTRSIACYNLSEDKLVKCSDGLAAVYNQWRISTVDSFIEEAEKLGYKICSM